MLENNEELPYLDEASEREAQANNTSNVQHGSIGGDFILGFSNFETW